MPCALFPIPHTLHPTPPTLHPTPHTPHTPHPTLYTLHPTPHTLHPPPYTLHPTPHTLHPKQSHYHTITSEVCCKYTRRASYNLLMTSVTPNVSHKFQYVSYFLQKYASKSESFLVGTSILQLKHSNLSLPLAIPHLRQNQPPGQLV